MHPSFFKELGPISIEQIKSIIPCETLNLINNVYFRDFVSLNRVTEKSLSFIYNNQNETDDLPLSSCFICSESKVKDLNPKQKVIVVKNVQETDAKISNIFYRDFTDDEKLELGEPVIGQECEIGKNVVIENGVTLGDRVKIDHGAVIKHNCIIGNNTKIGCNAVISNSIFGEDIYVGSNTSIGQRGFGFYLNNQKNLNIFHSGRVILKSNSSIGSGCTIDRGSFADTIIGENTYIDNLCHIAHNVEIGSNTALAAMTGIAGSAKIGDNVLTGGQAGIAGHITIGNNVHIAAKSGVFSSLSDGETVMGNPAVNKYSFIKNYKKIYGKREN